VSTTAATTADDIRRTDRQFLAASQRAGIPATKRQTETAGAK
jgi:hypothetical protein